MKLIIFMLAITLCFTSSSLRRVLQEEQDPEWLFNQAFLNEEEDLGNYPIGAEEEEFIPFPSEEETIPSTPEEEEEEQDLSDDNPTPNQPVVTPDGYTILTTDEIQGSAEVQAALNYGGNETIKYGYAKKKIPTSIYSITKVISVGKQTIENGRRNAYQCSVEIEDPRGILVKAQYVVYVKVSNDELFVKKWAYQIFNLRYADDPFPTTNNTTPNTTTPTDPTDPTTNTTTPTEPTTNTTTPDNTTEPTNNNTNPDSYIPLSVSEIETPEVQSILSFGADRILEKGYAAGKIPQSEYDITNIISVSKKTQNNGRVSYSCSIELRDENQVSVKAQFFITVRTATQDKSLASWSYQVSSKFSIDESAYIQLNNTEAQDNAEVKSCLDFAIEKLIANSEEFDVVGVNGVFTQTIKNTVYYKFDVKLDNKKGKTVELVATVAYKPASDSREVKAYATKTTTKTRK